MPPMLADRFAAAGAREPLNALGEPDRAELTALLLRVHDFDELPGRWQAALLAAETGASSGAGVAAAATAAHSRPGAAPRATRRVPLAASG